VDPVIIGTIERRYSSSAGQFAIVRRQPDGYQVPCRVGMPSKHVFVPYEDGEEVVAVCVDGDPRDGYVVICSTQGLGASPPPEVATNPNAVWVVHKDEVNILGATKVNVLGAEVHVHSKKSVVHSEEVHLGREAIGTAKLLQGVVTGDTMCPYTGQKHIDISSVVFAEKVQGDEYKG